MKVEIARGILTATAESVADIEMLMSLKNGGTSKHKKHLWKKTCDQCSKEFKGRAGLGIHKARIHRGKKWASRVHVASLAAIKTDE